MEAAVFPWLKRSFLVVNTMSDVVQSRDLSPEQSLASAAQLAAQWWTKQLMGIPKLDNGDTAADRVIAAIGLSQEPACSDPKLLKVFEDKLSSLLVEKFKSDSWAMRYGVSTGVDHHPDELLAEALMHANIYAGITGLPLKSSTTVFIDKVEIRRGDDAEPQTIVVADVIKADTGSVSGGLDGSASLPKLPRGA